MYLLRIINTMILCNFQQTKGTKCSLNEVSQNSVSYFRSNYLFLELQLCFQFAGPKEWNNLPLLIRESPSIYIFKSRLKAYLFNCAFN